jgi:capsid protein
MIDVEREAAEHKSAGLQLRMLEHENKLIETTLQNWDNLVSFDDEQCDGTGAKIWSKVGLSDFGMDSVGVAYTTDEELSEIRNRARWLAIHNEFAINGHENRVSYIAGNGHVYTVQAKAGIDVDPATIDDVRLFVDKWKRVNKWNQRQQEIVHRRDRDGEVFLRFFPGEDGILRVRFIEPEAIRTPQADETSRFGIVFKLDDAETAISYFVHKSADDEDPEVVDAEFVQHRKANVDLSAPRGIPIFFPVNKNLVRAEKLLRNVGHLTAFRATIAMIRKHVSGSKATIDQYSSQMADIQVQQADGKKENYTRYRPGTILDHPKGVEYEFPTHNTDVAGFLLYLEAELRAVAARLVMPEFMLTSNAANANYSSTMVAEGPAVKMFERLQADMVDDDQDVMRRALETATKAGLLPKDILALIDVIATPPNVRTRDRLKEAQADAILKTNGVLSGKTMAARHNLDWDDEQENMEAEADAGGFKKPDLGGEDDDQTGGSNDDTTG